MNQSQGLAILHVLKDTKMDENEFMDRFDPNNIVDVKIQVTTSDGQVHNITAFLEDLIWHDFINNKAKATKQSA